MDQSELNEIKKRAESACTYVRSTFDVNDGHYYPSENKTETNEYFKCPLCDGEGEVEGQRFDDQGPKASTVVAYGIGEGLRLAEEFVENAPADVLSLLAHIRELQTALVNVIQLCGRTCTRESYCEPCGAAYSVLPKDHKI